MCGVVRSHTPYANARELVYAGSLGGVFDLVYDSDCGLLRHKRHDKRGRVHNLAYENKRQ
jgi:hypothetical protein